jgi:hypothetical protein
VATPTRSRTFIVAVVSALAYYALLSAIYPRLPYVDVPAWWRSHWPSASVGLVSWFTLLNAAGAVAASIPVSLGLVWGLTSRRVAVGFGAGMLCAVAIAVGALVQYRSQLSSIALVTAAAQLVVIGVSVPILVRLIESRPLTTRWSGP